MKSPARRLTPFSAAYLFSVSALVAHPGHDGDHGLTWDLRHLAEHPLATAGCFALVGTTVLLIAVVLRRRAERQIQSLRVSQPSRGK